MELRAETDCRFGMARSHEGTVTLALWPLRAAWALLGGGHIMGGGPCIDGCRELHTRTRYARSMVAEAQDRTQ